MLHEPLTNEQQESILEEVGYSREQLELDLEAIREWLNKQYHLPPSRLKENDNFLKYYLTGCKGSLEKVKRKLDAYYTYRSHSEIYDERDPMLPEYLEFKRNGYYGILPKVIGTKNPVILVLTKMLNSDPAAFELVYLARMIFNSAEIQMRLQPFSIRKVLVLDAKGFNAGHVVKMRPTLLRDILRIAQDILPLRFASWYILNVPAVLETALNTLVLPFLSKKLRERTHITSGGYEEMSKFVEKSYLPKDFEGDSPSLAEITERLFKKEHELRDWFMNELSERCDESKRIIQGDTMTNPYFGVPGSLKKLVID